MSRHIDQWKQADKSYLLSLQPNIENKSACCEREIGPTIMINPVLRIVVFTLRERWTNNTTEYTYCKYDEQTGQMTRIRPAMRLRDRSQIIQALRFVARGQH